MSEDSAETADTPDSPPESPATPSAPPIPRWAALLIAASAAALAALLLPSATRGPQRPDVDVSAADAPLTEALALQEAGKHSQAMTAFARALKINPALVPAHNGMARSALARLDDEGADDAAGILDEAARFVEQALRVDPASWEAYHLRGEIAIRRARIRFSAEDLDGASHQATAAEADLGQALQLAPKEAAILRARGTARQALAQVAMRRKPPDGEAAVAGFQGAADDFTRAVTMAPSHPDAYARRAHVAVKLSRLDRAQSRELRQSAVDDLRRAIERTTDDRERAARHYERAVILRTLGKAGEAMADLDRSLTLDGDRSSARVARAELLFAARKYKAALLDYQVALKLAPRARTFDGAAVAFEALGKDDSALMAYNEAINRDPRRNGVLLRRGRLLQRMGHPARAHADFTELLKRRPDDPDALIARGLASWALRKHDDARKDLERAVAVAPRNPRAQLNLGRLHVAQNRMKAARAAFDKALALDPDLVEAYQARGMLKLAAKDAAGALADFDQSIALAPRYPLPHLGRGQALELGGDLDGAIEAYSTAARLNNRFVDAFVARARAYRKRKRLTPATADLQRATRLSPGSWGLWRDLGLVLSESGKWKAAREAWIKSRAIAPKSAHADLDRRLAEAARKLGG